MRSGQIDQKNNKASQSNAINNKVINNRSFQFFPNSEFARIFIFLKNWQNDP